MLKTILVHFRTACLFCHLIWHAGGGHARANTWDADLMGEHSMVGFQKNMRGKNFHSEKYLNEKRPLHLKDTFHFLEELCRRLSWAKFVRMHQQVDGGIRLNKLAKIWMNSTHTHTSTAQLVIRSNILWLCERFQLVWCQNQVTTHISTLVLFFEVKWSLKAKELFFKLSVFFDSAVIENWDFLVWPKT